MKTAKEWVIGFLHLGKTKPTHAPLSLGSRVRTKFGSGTVTGGSVHIKYDEDCVKNLPKSNGRRIPTERTHSHSLDEIELETLNVPY